MLLQFCRRRYLPPPIPAAPLTRWKSALRMNAIVGAYADFEKMVVAGSLFNMRRNSDLYAYRIKRKCLKLPKINLSIFQQFSNEKLYPNQR